MMTLLIVEDNEIIRNNLSHIININFVDIKVLTASTGEKAIELLKKENIDIFLLDIELPDITGLEIAQEIRSIEKYMFSFIVFITGHTFLLKEALQKYNCYDFIEKPFGEEKIIEIINKLLKGFNREVVQIKKHIKIENGTYLYKVYLEDIIYIEIQGRVLKVHTQSGIISIQNVSLQKVMTLIENADCDYLMMTHRSYIVNVDKIYCIKLEHKRLWQIHFQDYKKFALLSHKFKNNLSEKM